MKANIILFKPSALQLFIILQVFCFSQYSAGQVYLKSIKTQREFRKLSGDPLTEKYGQVDAVKVVYDIANDELYYINSKQFEIHYQFCEQVLRYDKGHELFNDDNYSNASANRQYLLGNINYFRSSGFYVFDISPLDFMKPGDIQLLFTKVQATTCFGSKIRLLINSTHVSSMYKEHQLSVPVIMPTEIYKNQQYQFISKCSGYGYLRKLGDNKNPDRVSPHDIVIVDGGLIHVPPVAGIITTELQTPLSHISILTVNREIPCIAYTRALKDSVILKLVNKYVYFNVKADTFYLKEALVRKPIISKPELVVLKKDLSADSLIETRYLSRKSVACVGNKAAYFSFLAAMSKKAGFAVPESSFAIPFFFYEQHMKKSGAGQKIDDLLADTACLHQPEQLKVKLKAIRKCIEDTPLDGSFLKAVEIKIVRLGNYRRMRFRSSTNAEDMQGFSGAGLYESKTGIVGDSIRSVEKAIKKVWASLWNYNAFNERELYAIDHRSSAMGILVHRSYPSEIANGVAVTKNLYRPESYGFTLNIQLGEESVVNPTKGTTCEQLICYPKLSTDFFKDKKVVEIITYSSLSENKLIFTEDELLHLANALDKIKSNLFTELKPGGNYFDFGLDIEFKLDGRQRQLYIDQVRVYND